MGMPFIQLANLEMDPIKTEQISKKDMVQVIL